MNHVRPCPSLLAFTVRLVTQSSSSLSALPTLPPSPLSLAFTVLPLLVSHPLLLSRLSLLLPEFSTLLPLGLNSSSAPGKPMRRSTPT